MPRPLSEMEIIGDNREGGHLMARTRVKPRLANPNQHERHTVCGKTTGTASHPQECHCLPVISSLPTTLWMSRRYLARDHDEPQLMTQGEEKITGM